jgi:hypothetical protein
MELGKMEEELRYVHVVNWSNYRSLMAEISGARWSTLFDKLEYKQYYDTARLDQDTQVWTKP